MTPLYDKILNAWVLTQAHEYLNPIIKDWNNHHPENPWTPTDQWLQQNIRDIIWDALTTDENVYHDDDEVIWFSLKHTLNPDLDNTISPRLHRLYWAADAPDFLKAASTPTLMPIHRDSAQAVIDRELADHNTQILNIPDMPDWETAVKTHTPNGYHDETNHLYWVQAPLHTDLLPGWLYLATPLNAPIVY